MSIEQCKALGNQQAAYFIQRDLAFRKDVKLRQVFLFDLFSNLYPFCLARISSSFKFKITCSTERNN